MNFSSNFFWKVHLIRCFRELNVRKFRKFSPDHFYDEKFQFYDKKTDFRPLGITSETTRDSGWISGHLARYPTGHLPRHHARYPASQPNIRLDIRPNIRPPVVSLVIPGRPSSHSCFPGARRLTRDSRIPAHFFVKNP